MESRAHERQRDWQIVVGGHGRPLCHRTRTREALAWIILILMRWPPCGGAGRDVDMNSPPRRSTFTDR
jgi:hypothetical protein